MTDSIASLLKLLDLVEVEPDLFRGGSPATSLQRVFGGQVVAQALRAAGRTVPTDRLVHSMHAYFLRPGDPDQPIHYAVERVRDGRSFTTRLVVGRQQGRAIFDMSASFQALSHGVDHQDPMPDAPEPLAVPTLAQRMDDDPEAWSAYYREWASFDVRPVTGPRDPLIAPEGRASHNQVWFRAADVVPDDPLLQACALAYASDLTLLAVALAPHTLLPTDPRLQMASLDHAVWFHRPFSVGEWLLYDQSSPSAGGSRGLASGRIFTRSGVLVASVMQEGLIRLHD